MADNFAITPGAGVTIAADDISSVWHQRVKISAGADGSATDVSAAAPLPVISAARLVAPTASLTRPADTTAYAAGDELSNSTTAPTIMTFSSCVQANGGSGTLMGAFILSSVASANPPLLELWLFNATNTPQNDNSAFGPSDAEAANVIAVLPMSTSFQAANNALYTAPSISVPFRCAGGTTSLFGRLVHRGAYTPVASEVFTVNLRIWQD